MTNKFLMAAVIIFFGHTAAIANNSSGSALNPSQNIPKKQPLKLQLGRELDAKPEKQCKLWKTRCYKQRFCRRYKKDPCYSCQKYLGYSNYSNRNTCDIKTVHQYQNRGYWCYEYRHYSGKCHYYYKKYCTQYCYK